MNKQDIRILHLKHRSGGLGVLFSGIVSRLCLPVLELKEAVQITSWKKDTKISDDKRYIKLLICKLGV